MKICPKITIIASFLFALSLTTLLAAQVPFADEMRNLEKSFGGRFGFMAKNLQTGEVIAYHESEKFPTASLIKLPIMVEFFYQAAEGRVDSLQKLVLAETNRVGGSGLLQHFSQNPVIRLSDAVLLMIVVSDNSATNLVIDAFGQTHAEKLAAVNNRMQEIGLKNTRLWNKVMSWATKTDSSESIRYGLGVSTPADMVLLLEKIYRDELADSLACRKMIDILTAQAYNDAMPRLLPAHIPGLRVAHKTGGVTGVRTDAGLVLSDHLDLAVAAFCDQALFPTASAEEQAQLAIATATRLAWDYFNHEQTAATPSAAADWNPFPGGEWARVFLKTAPYPHISRQDGWHHNNQFFPRDPHYIDSSAVIIIPSQFKPDAAGIDFIFHFHGWNNDNLGVLEQFRLPQQLAASRRNAILVLMQGPWHASDSGGGKMEDPGGFQRLVEEVRELLRREKRIQNQGIGNIIISAHSGGYRPAIYAVSRGGLQDKISSVFLFDAFYAHTGELIPWLKMDKTHRLRSVYTEHLAEEHQTFMDLLRQNRIGFTDTFKPNARVVLESTGECHNCVIFGRFQRWLENDGGK